MAAASLIAECAGCVVTDRRGQRFRFNQAPPLGDGLIVAAPALHAEILGALVVLPPGRNEGTAE